MIVAWPPAFWKMLWVRMPENPDTLVLLKGPVMIVSGLPPAVQAARMMAFTAASVTVPWSELSPGATTIPDVNPEEVGEPPEPSDVKLLESHDSRLPDCLAEPAPPALEALFCVNCASMSRLIRLL